MALKRAFGLLLREEHFSGWFCLPFALRLSVFLGLLVFLGRRLVSLQVDRGAGHHHIVALAQQIVHATHGEL